MEQTIDKRAEMMGTAKVPGAIVKLAVPAIVSMVVMAIYNMADTYFVSMSPEGYFGTAAVSVYMPIMLLRRRSRFCLRRAARPIFRGFSARRKRQKRAHGDYHHHPFLFVGDPCRRSRGNLLPNRSCLRSARREILSILHRLRAGSAHCLAGAADQYGL